MSDCVKEVRFAQAGAAVDEEGVVAASGGIGHRLGSGAGQLVGGAHYKGVEGEFSAVHHGGWFLVFLVLEALELFVVQQAHGDIGGEDVLEAGFDIRQKPVLDVGAFEVVGAMEDEFVALQGDDGCLIEPGFDSGF